MEKRNSKLAKLCRARISLLTTGQWDDEFQGSVRWRKSDDFHVLQAHFAADGEHVVFGDVLLAFRINDPEGGCTLQRFRDSFHTTQIFLPLPTAPHALLITTH